MTTPADQLTARQLGHEGAAIAANAAEWQIEDWKDRAYDAFLTIASIGAPFTTEDVRVACPDIPAPPDARAWGQVALRAKKAGVVKSVGVVNAKLRNVHGRYITQWAMA